MGSYAKLKSDIKEAKIGNFYIFFGEEDYLKNDCLHQIEKKLLDEDFKSFNLEKFDIENFDINDFENAVEALPAMSDRKLILVRDIDIFKLKADIKDQIIKILSDLPEYVCVIFDYATVEYKPDNRQKLAKIIKEKAEVVEFEYLSQKDLNTWITRRFNASNLKIKIKTLEYFTFMCSFSMTNLVSEIEKLCVYSKDEVTKEDIDEICSKVLEAQIFDITDKIIKNDILGAKSLIDDLILLKVEEFSIISVINSQFQRLYSGKLGVIEGRPDKFYMDLWGIRSNFAIKINLDQARKLDIDFLKNACKIATKASMDMVSVNLDKIDIIYNLITSIGAINDKN